MEINVTAKKKYAYGFQEHMPMFCPRPRPQEQHRAQSFWRTGY
jgi:hypothetical protein